ncbi:MAG: 1-deoxy-D-xylulose-5-phosphate reductoisomerase [Puniceicoccales bacterium]|jgi:1-deoxy-D-xylulose-5-phosphate reductoisomerase|nr:1-deoxy-D-xylulose-5-phosphate reductoisomerase [Puniceicoccales bacterium]
MCPKKRIVILGATGSVGSTVLSEIARYPDLFQVVGVSCYSAVDQLESIVHRFSPRAMAVVHRTVPVPFHFSGPLFRGIDGLTRLIDAVDFDVLVVALSGVNGLGATLRAMERNKDIILANKEILVIAGAMVMHLAQRKGVRVLPLDSEHNAIFQCTHGDHRFIRNLWLTASGGKLWHADRKTIDAATVEMVLQHPKWSMGKKITVDSSTMANKGLEIIEAMHFFSIGPERIKVVIHRDCIVHSLVEFCDGSFLAQLSPPSMKYATRHCLFFPERGDVEEPSLDLYELAALKFERPDGERFPCLRLAMEVARERQSKHIAFNGANEVAVELFLQKKIGFGAIPGLVESVLGKIESKDYGTLEEVLAVDQMVRTKAKQLAKRFYI